MGCRVHLCLAHWLPTTTHRLGIYPALARNLAAHCQYDQVPQPLGPCLIRDLPHADGSPGTFAAVQYAYDEAGNMLATAWPAGGRRARTCASATTGWAGSPPWSTKRARPTPSLWTRRARWR
ncbi:MAG: hypothetical protein EOO62_02560 [Hymenobacter sp.]|nr:MAG: hypothetical protein EOO62_02560 [Hymenobacter sp.]